MNLVQKKICLLGDYSVGKTSLVRRYVKGRFDEKYLSTVGVKVDYKLIELEEFSINLIIWDLAGGSEFENYEVNYLRGAAAALLVCDLTRSETLSYLSKYAEKMMNINPQAILLVAANKKDLDVEKVVCADELDHIGTRIGCRVFQTSAKTGENVEECLNTIATLLAKKVEIDSQ